jgi:hypothetical protein
MTDRSKILVAIAFGLVIASQAKAEGLTVGLHTISAHIPQHAQNNVNPGAYLRTANGVELGLYRNSWRRPSLYVSQQFDLVSGSYGSLSLQAGLVSGYQKRCEVTQTTIPGATHVEHRDDGSTVTTRDPPTINTHTECKGFSRGAITALAGFSYLPPMAFMGITPRVQFLPPLGKSGALIHLTVERTFK